MTDEGSNMTCFSSCIPNSHVDEQNPNFAGLNIAGKDKEFTGMQKI